MMKLALIIAIYYRHDLEKIVLDSYRKQSKKFGFEIIIAGSEGEISQEIAKGCHYIEINNYPVSAKHNSMLAKAKELNVDGVVLMGSDDIVNDGFWENIYNNFTANEQEVIGLKDLYFYSTESKNLGYWAGYVNGTQSVGAGRFFSKHVLDTMNWKLWGDRVNKGLDSNCTLRCLSNGINDRTYTMKESGAFLVDIKHSRSITDHAILNLCKSVNFEIMAKKVASKTVEQVKELKKPAKIDLDRTKMYEVVSTGNNKYLGKAGNVHFVNGETAEILINKGFAKL